jgi:rubrerythrin
MHVGRSFDPIVTHFDPSWCARINAHRHTRPETPAPAARVDAAAETERDSGGEAARSMGSPYRLREVPTTHVCECCGTVMYDHNCKIVCPNCGYKRDCSDP